jgi:hypothetical protein
MKPGFLPKPVEERFWNLVEEPYDSHNDCWFWKGSKDRKNYGRFYLDSSLAKPRRYVSAHKFCWNFFNGPVPGGLEIDHLCRNRACVNPMHLEAVPHRVNIQRSPLVGALCRKKLIVQQATRIAGKIFCSPRAGKGNAGNVSDLMECADANA